jgi:malonyl-CoA O-methyltransferase
MLSAREAYRAWAPTYGADSAVTFLENSLVEAFAVPIAGRTLLDAGCGTGRRIADTCAALAVGVDFSIEMLTASTARTPLAAADVRRLPFGDERFDIVWCRLVIGYVPDIGIVYGELARVCRRGGTILITDFHPDAAAAGHRRTFRDGAGTTREIESYVHTAETHMAAATRAGLLPGIRRDGEVGPDVHRFYIEAGKDDLYESQRGQRIVLALEYAKR